MPGVPGGAWGGRMSADGRENYNGVGEGNTVGRSVHPGGGEVRDHEAASAAVCRADDEKASEAWMTKPSLFSIKKPCQYFDRSCKNSLQVKTFGKAHNDVNAIPSKILTPIGKLIFYAFASEARGTRKTVWVSDSELALKCGVTRVSVVANRPRLVELGLMDKAGGLRGQVQGYRIVHPAFQESKEVAEVAAKVLEMKTCPNCHKQRRGLLRVGWCRSCNSVKTTEAIARRVYLTEASYRQEEGQSAKEGASLVG